LWGTQREVLVLFVFFRRNHPLLGRTGYLSSRNR
jgi:hypothetical protein